QELLALVLDRGQKVPTGSSFNYSNLGYSLLGLVIAAVSGQSYNDFVRESITEPLGLLAQRRLAVLAARVHELPCGVDGVRDVTGGAGHESEEFGTGGEAAAEGASL
ncbi:serine hydrolase, partial [Bacillus sp. S34]|nr:serine hydrolase [Bacillus sp. S34]